MSHHVELLEFKIEEICDDRVSKKASTMGEKEYHIKWVDFNSSENTWEVGTIFLLSFFVFVFFSRFEKCCAKNISTHIYLYYCIF